MEASDTVPQIDRILADAVTRSLEESDGHTIDVAAAATLARTVVPDLLAKVEKLTAERDDFRNAALMHAATVDELRRHIDRANAERDAMRPVVEAAGNFVAAWSYAEAGPDDEDAGERYVTARSLLGAAVFSERSDTDGRR